MLREEAVLSAIVIEEASPLTSMSPPPTVRSPVKLKSPAWFKVARVVRPASPETLPWKVRVESSRTSIVLEPPYSASEPETEASPVTSMDSPNETKESSMSVITPSVVTLIPVVALPMSTMSERTKLPSMSLITPEVVTLIPVVAEPISTVSSSTRLESVSEIVPVKVRLPVISVLSSRLIVPEPESMFTCPVVEPPTVRSAMLVVARLPSPVR